MNDLYVSIVENGIKYYIFEMVDEVLVHATTNNSGAIGRGQTIKEAKMEARKILNKPR
jgi:hypothetical protein